MHLRILKMTQLFSHNFRVQQIRFRLGLHPGPLWGAYSTLPDRLANLRGPTSKERGGKEGCPIMEIPESALTTQALVDKLVIVNAVKHKDNHLYDKATQ